MEWLYITLGAIAFFALLYGIACVCAFRFAFRRNGKQGQNGDYVKAHRDDPILRPTFGAIERMRQLPCEDVYIRSADGLRLHARLFDAENAVGTVIQFHGYRSYGDFDFAAAFDHLNGARRLRVLLVDQRACEASEGKYITFGIAERHDCAAWASWASERFGTDEPLWLEGMSLGASTVLMASALPMPDNLAGIIADCGYSSPDAILRKVGKEMHLPLGLLLPGVYFLCRHAGHFDPRETDAPTELAKSALPVLFFHGEDDGFVPFRMGRENFEAAAGEKYFCAVPGADHGKSYLVDPDKVTRMLDDFLDRTDGLFAAKKAGKA